MQITIKATGLELTPAIKEFIEEKIGSLDKFIKRYEQSGEILVSVEIARSTKHHHKGDVFHAEANAHLPRKLLRAEDEDFDVRVAVNKVKERLHREIVDYKNTGGHSGSILKRLGHASGKALKRAIWWRRDKEE